MATKAKTNDEVNTIENTESVPAIVEDPAVSDVEKLSALEERIAQLEEMLAAKKGATGPAPASSVLPPEVIENEKRMRELIDFYVPVDPINRSNTDLKVMNPITESLMILKRGERVKIPRCVYEILQHSDEQNIVVADLTDKLAREYEESENKS